MFMQGVNIWSGGQGLAAALTNPTELAYRKGRLMDHYPVALDGRVFEDAEEAYLSLRKRSRDQEVMARVICMKLQQHPILGEYVEANGGIGWLAKCRHETGARTERFQWWEGTGLSSPFISTLVDGYSRSRDGKRYFEQTVLPLHTTRTQLI